MKHIFLQCLYPELIDLVPCPALFINGALHSMYSARNALLNPGTVLEFYSPLRYHLGHAVVFYLFWVSQIFFFIMFLQLFIHYPFMLSIYFLIYFCLKAVPTAILPSRYEHRHYISHFGVDYERFEVFLERLLLVWSNCYLVRSQGSICMSNIIGNVRFFNLVFTFNHGSTIA